MSSLCVDLDNICVHGVQSKNVFIQGGGKVKNLYLLYFEG